MDEIKQTIRVLVVDDEKAVADSMVMLLRAKDYDPTAAYSGEEGVEFCKALKPHVVISDIVMGPMSGFDLAIWLAENQPACRIILMSAHSFHDPLVAKSMRRGFEFLRKPIHPAKLFDVVSGSIAAQDLPIEPMQQTTATEEPE
jgi:DNA-binding NtrC family response regulator